MKNKPDKTPGKIVGNCYLCNCIITNQMIFTNKALYIGKGVYRCRSKKCQAKILNNFLNKKKRSN